MSLKTMHQQEAARKIWRADIHEPWANGEFLSLLQAPPFHFNTLYLQLVFQQSPTSVELTQRRLMESNFLYQLWNSGTKNLFCLFQTNVSSTMTQHRKTKGEDKFDRSQRYFQCLSNHCDKSIFLSCIQGLSVVSRVLRTEKGKRHLLKNCRL